jgi:hypothetical protein
MNAVNRERTHDNAVALYNGITVIRQIGTPEALMLRLRELHDIVRAMKIAIQLFKDDATTQFGWPILLTEGVVKRLSRLEVLIPQIGSADATQVKETLTLIVEIRDACSNVDRFPGEP